MRRFIVLYLILCLPGIAFTQNTDKSFPDDRDGFIKAVTDMLNATKRDDCKQTADDLNAAWPAISASNQGDIIDLAQAMRSRKMLVTPYFQKFFAAIIYFEKKKPGNELWDQWRVASAAVLNNIRQGNNKKFDDWLDFSIALFSQNALYISQGRTWKFDADVFDIVLEKGTPVLKFDDGTVLGLTEGDSIRIEETSGRYDPLDKIWRGTKGRADWQRVGFGTDEVYVNFGAYTIDATRSTYSVDSVSLHYGDYRKAVIKGSFSDKMLAHTSQEYASYPRFDSYKKNLTFEDVAPHVKVFGGLQLAGAKMNLDGTDDEKATIKIYRFDGLVGVIAKSKHFDIQKDKEINASQAAVKLVLGKDSIYHPGVGMRYNIEKRELFLLRGKNGIQKSDYYDYYHGFEENPELIYWDMNEPEMIMRNIAVGGKSSMYVESMDYFRQDKLDKYKGIADYNFIDRMLQAVAVTGNKEFDAEDLAKRIDPHYSLEIIQPMLYKLVEDGFIDYDDNKQLVTVRAKAFQYVAARAKKIDYDNIRLESTSDSINATMDMRNYNMLLSGVKSFVLSDSNFVVAFPRQNQLTLREDRNMDFDGQMFAGRLDLTGEGFTFNYNNFRIDLADVDSVVINIPRGGHLSDGSVDLGPIKSVISDVTGNLQIDSKDNRSGNKHHPQYPVLTTTEPSFVYYDNNKVLGGVYDRNKFFFKLDPFTFDSLNSYNWQKIRFPGKLVSDGIFPDLTENVTIQKDYSLGFITTRKDAPLYGGKGKFTNTITLDNSGLRGKGEIRFVTSTTKSKDIIYFPDSMLAKADSFNMRASVFNGIEFPNVRGAIDKVRWLPYEDSMLVKEDSVPFDMFDYKTTMRGTLVLQSTGLRGSGFVDWADATLSSNDIGFGRNKMDADSCDFVIKSLDPKKFALKTQDVNASVDFDKRIGSFKSNTDDITTSFPYNDYNTSINEFKWYMDKKRMTFVAPPGTQGDFTSVRKGQDSLTFRGGNASYDLTNYILRVNKVPEILVADSRIVPDSGKVVIEPEAKMRTLYRAKLIADSVSEYHTFDSVTANVYGKNSFKATGNYRFINNTGKVQKIYCDDIAAGSDSTHKHPVVYAHATVDTSRKLLVLPKIYYKGKVNITSNKEPVEFKGYAKLDIKNPKVRAEWFSIDDYIAKDSAYLAFHDPQNEAHKDMAAGLFFDADSSNLYTSFFNAKKSSRDKNLFSVNGIVYYDDTAHSFIAGDPQKIINGASRGNVLRFNDAKGRVTAEGKMNMGFNYGLVNAQIAGNISYEVNKEDPVFHVALGLYFPMDEDLLGYIAQSVLKGNGGGDAADYSTDEFQNAIVEFIKPKDEDEWRQTVNKTGRIVSSDALPYTVFLSDVELKWDKATRVFYNTKPFSVAFVGKNSIATVVPGYIEMGFKRSGDFFNLYLPAGEEEDDYWFYFNYAAGNMQVAAGEKAFTDKLLDIKPEKRRTETKDGKHYQYNTGSANKKNTFVNRMKFLQQENYEREHPPKKKK